MRLVLSSSPPRRQPFAAALALAVHAGVITALLGRAAAPVPSSTAPDPAIPLPLWPAELDTGSPGAPAGAPATLETLLPAPAPLAGPGPVISPLPLPPGVGSGNPTGPVGLPGRISGGPVRWDHVLADQEVQPPRMLDSLELPFPPGARGGLVEVEYVITTTGRVDLSSYHVMGNPDSALAAAVRGALAVARFRPALRGDRPVRSVVRQRFRFERQERR